MTGSTYISQLTSMAVDASAENASNATVLLNALERGDTGAADSLLAMVYDELRRLAAHKMGQEAPGTLQPTALVHEAWLKLVGVGGQQFKNRPHFLAVAAEAMRRILIDRARKRKTHRHGGQHKHVEIDDNGLASPAADDQLLAEDESLDPFEQLTASGDAYARFHLENPLALRLLSLHDVDSKGDERVEQAADRIQASIRSMLDHQEALVLRALESGGNEGVSARAVTVFLFGAWNGAISMHARGQLTRPELDGVLSAGQNLAIGAIRSGNASGLVQPTL